MPVEEPLHPNIKDSVKMRPDDCSPCFAACSPELSDGIIAGMTSANAPGQFQVGFPRAMTTLTRF